MRRRAADSRRAAGRQRASRDLVLVLRGDRRIGVRQELREAAGRNERVEGWILVEDVLHLLYGAGEIVIGVERAAISFLPAVLAGEAGTRRFGALGTGEGVADALHALVVIGRGGAARLDADRAALRLDLL